MKKTKEKKEGFVLLITGVSDNDRAVKELLGSDRPVYFKSRYTQPYEEFKELKKLLLLVKEMDCLTDRAEIAIDLGEWVGHEQEEYFVIMLKYLHDQSYRWSYCFTVGDHSRSEAARLYIKLKTYLSGSIVEDTTLTAAESLSDYLCCRFAFRPDAAKVLAGLLLSREMKTRLSYELVDSVCGELRELTGARGVTVNSLREYLGCEDSLVCMLLGKTVDINREERYETA